MLCCTLRRARYSDAVALFVATVGTLLAMPWLPGSRAVTGADATPVAGQVTPDALGACARAFSSLESGQDGLDGRVTPDPAFAAAVCRAQGGDGCALDGLVPLETALCVAEEEALGEGQAAHAFVSHDPDHEGLVWRVQAARALGSCERELANVDAHTGELLGVTHLRDPFCQDPG